GVENTTTDSKQWVLSEVKVHRAQFRARLNFNRRCRGRINGAGVVGEHVPRLDEFITGRIRLEYWWWADVHIVSARCDPVHAVFTSVIRTRGTNWLKRPF